MEVTGLVRRVPWGLLVVALFFAVAHTQAPLYYSNQNQYFLHGLAAAGRGQLHEDWLANTRDPTPVFSALVTGTEQHLGEWAFYACYVLLLAGYFVSLVVLCEALPMRPASASARLLFYALLTAAHAAVASVASVELLGVDYPAYLQRGLAAQYVLGPGLQPSAFGVLLIASLAAYAHGRLCLAAGFCSAAAIMHSTYLLPASLLTTGYLVALWRQGSGRRAFWLAAGSLLAVLPVVVYNLSQFSPTSAGAFSEAQRLLAEVRIPHHAVVARWMDKVAWAQVAWVLLGLALLRRTRLFFVLVLTFALALVLTLVQLATASNTLALLFPWRISAVLVPVATAVIVASFASAAVHQLERLACPTSWVAWVAGLTIVALAGGGVAVSASGTGYKMDPDEVPAMDFVRDQVRPGDVYLLPVSIPKVGSGRGAVATTFTPPARVGREGNQIAVDLQRFRLYTGAPIYVDFKAIPYKDTEVLEWHRRMQKTMEWYAQSDWGPTTAAELRAEGITHVLVPVDRDLKADFLEAIYQDQTYRVYRLGRPSGRE